MTRERRIRVQWTEQEDEELRRIYAISQAGLAAAGLRRLAASKGIEAAHCRERAYSLGLARAGVKRRLWTEAELLDLKAYAGVLSPRQIARKLSRTPEAVTCQLHRMQLSGLVKHRGYFRYELADLMGLDLETLRNLLTRFPMKKNALGNFSESTVQFWVFDHLENLELRKFDQDWLKKMLKGAA